MSMNERVWAYAELLDSAKTAREMDAIIETASFDEMLTNKEYTELYSYAVNLVRFPDVKVYWVSDLPDAVLAELKEDAVEDLKDEDMTPEEVSDVLDELLTEKLHDVIGYEEGMLPAWKYGRFAR